MFHARCYCGSQRLTFGGPAEVVAYCHCSDCKRWTGSPLPAYAAFAPLHVSLNAGGLQEKSHATGVTRWNCPDCGSPIMATFDYTPDQVYVPLGVIEEAGALPPQLHCHAEHALHWLPADDATPRVHGSGGVTLRAAKT